MKVWLLGIPFDALADPEIEKKALSFVRDFEGDYKTRYVTSPSFRAIDNVLGFTGVKDEELLQYYRQANLSLISHKPLLFLSWCLGDPIPAEISSSRLVSELVETMTFMGKKLFLLGSNLTDVERGALEITARFPLAEIGGVSSVDVFLNGAQPENIREKDQMILNAINQSGADLLLVKLDKRKEANWLRRVDKQLKIPLAMGIGTALGKYSYSGNRLFRYILDGIQSLKRGFKFVVFATPLAIFYKFNEWLSSFTHTGSCPTLCQKNTLLFLSDRKTIEVLRLPCLLDKDRVYSLSRRLPEFLEQDEFIIDFSKLKHLDLFGFQFLYKLFQRRKETGKGILGIRMSGDVRWLLKLNKLWDVLGDTIVPTAKEALARMYESESLFVSVEQDEEGVHLYFLGKLSSDLDYDALLERLLPVVGQKHLIIHTEYLTHLTDYGKWFLKRLETLARTR